VAFKAGTNDLRESGGLKVVELLLQSGASATVYDPLVQAEQLEELAKRGVKRAGSLEFAVQEAEACILTTNDPEFDQLDTIISSAPGSRPIVIDGRRAVARDRFDPSAYFAIGYGRTTNGD